MSRKIWTIILLCILTLLLLAAVAVYFGTLGVDINMSEQPEDVLPGSGIVAVFLLAVAFFIIEFSIASLGFILSLICTKIAPTPLLVRISSGYFALYALGIIGLVVCILFVIF